MKILALDSASKTASACVWEDGRILSSAFVNAGLTHSATLMPAADFALKTAGLALRDMDLLAVTSGPGSFTGLRIGIAAVKGMAWAAEKQCIAVSSLEALAYARRDRDGIVCATLDARRDQVYGAIFRIAGGNAERLTADSAISAAELAEDLAEYGESVFLTGDGAELVKKYCDNAVLLPAEERCIRAEAVASAAAAATGDNAAVPPELLRPAYLRKPQAEREREERGL